MPHRNKPQHPPPPDGIERRQEYRREEDTETHEIVDKAVEVAPIVNRILHTSKVAVAVAVLFTMAGTVGGALGYRAIGPRQEIAELAARVDTALRSTRNQTMQVSASADSARRSLGDQLADLRRVVDQMAYIQCVQVRRSDPDLRPNGCDAAGFSKSKTP